jgi:hypothetical protein
MNEKERSHWTMQGWVVPPPSDQKEAVDQFQELGSCAAAVAKGSLMRERKKPAGISTRAGFF